MNLEPSQACAVWGCLSEQGTLLGIRNTFSFRIVTLVSTTAGVDVPALLLARSPPRSFGTGAPLSTLELLYGLGHDETANLILKL